MNQPRSSIPGLPFLPLPGSFYVTQTIKTTTTTKKKRASRPSTPLANRPLTAREIEVAKLLALGKHHREIAKDLGISPKTVDSHRMNALAKLKLPNNVLLARHAISVGWVPVPSLAN